MRKSIYIIKNKINNKVYIGQSINPHRRFVQHLCNGNRLLDNLPIHLAINKYGKHNFYYEILEQDIENYDDREQYWIKYYNSQCPNGYNVLEGGTSNPALKGDSHPRSTISESVAQNIIEQLLYTNHTQRKIALDNNCSERIVNSINGGQTRKQEDLVYPIRQKFCHYSTNTLNEIKWLLIYSDASFQSIANFYGFTKGTIAQINCGKSHYDKNIHYPLRRNKTGKVFTKEQIVTELTKGCD